jgi:hypothetical protein
MIASAKRTEKLMFRGLISFWREDFWNTGKVAWKEQTKGETRVGS